MQHLTHRRHGRGFGQQAERRDFTVATVHAIQRVGNAAPRQ